jgi:hypothetical protein
MIEAEEKTTNALNQLNLAGNIFDQPKENTTPVNSQGTSQGKEDKQMEIEPEPVEEQMSIASGEYDKQD